jgi:hypothetical protein
MQCKVYCGRRRRNRSENLEKYLTQYKNKIGRCDGVIWESGIVDEKGL